MTTKLSIPIKRLPGNDDIPLPAYETAGSAGMDIRAAVESPLTLAPGKIALVPCGISIAVPAGFEAQVRPRSGLASKFGITLINSPGTIDSDYRGEVKVPVINLGSEPYQIVRGARSAQMIVAAVTQVEWRVTDELESTKRDAGGFGHTGNS